jgi:putative membrane fusion protein
MNRSTLKRLFGSLAFRILIIVLILYTVYHCVAAFSDRVITDVVTNGVDRVTLSGEAVIVRNEQILTISGGAHLCSYPVANGAKVNATTTLAELYATNIDEQQRQQAQATLHALDRQIALCAQLPTADMLASLPSLQSAAREQLLQNIRMATAGGRLSDIDDGSFALLLSLNRIGALTGEGGSASSLIASLRAERQKVLMAASYTAKTITLDSLGMETTGGYFFYADTVDGYEHIFNSASLDTMTADEWNTLIQSERRTYGNDTTVIGKLVNGFRWHIVLPVSSSTAERVEAGKSYTVIFNHEQQCELRMTLERVITSAKEEQALLVLSSTTMPQGFSYTRFSDVEIVIDEMKGYRVPETALQHLDGRDGVYVLDGGRVTWRDIRIISRAEGYLLVYAPTKAERESEEDDTYHYDRYLNIRDIVITDGDELYDGKYIE